MRDQLKNCSQWFAQHEGFTLAIITLFALVYLAGLENGYAVALRLPTTKIISLSHYTGVFVKALAMFGTGGLFLWYVPKFVPARFWETAVNRGPMPTVWVCALFLVMWLDSFFVENKISLGGFMPMVMSLLMLVTLLALAVRSMMRIGEGRWAPITFCCVFLACYFLGFAVGRSNAETRAMWRVVQIEGSDEKRLILDEREGEFITVPLERINGKWAYRLEFKYIERSDNAISTHVENLGRLRIPPKPF